MQPLEKVVSVQNTVSPHVWPITNLCLWSETLEWDISIGEPNTSEVLWTKSLLFQNPNSFCFIYFFHLF